MNNFYLSPEGDRYYLGTQFTYDGRIYQGTTATFASLGFTEVVVEPMPNPTYYTVGNVNDDGTWNYTAKPLADVQTNLITNSNNTSHSTLAPTDWYVIREVENATPVPTEYTNWRQSVRDAADAYDSLVSAAPDVTTIENDIGSTPVFPPSPDNAPTVGTIYVEGTNGSDLLDVLGTEDPSNPGTYLPLTEAQFGQFGVGMYLNKFGSIIDGEQITEILASAGQLRIGSALTANLSAVAPVFAWSDYADPVITGTLNTGRSSNDMNPSWYLSFVSEDPDITGADTYLYQPSTATTMPYLPSQVPPGFDSMGDCFDGADFTLQIKFGAAVIATITCPSGANTGVPF
jgi:hypothetical protein